MDNGRPGQKKKHYFVLHNQEDEVVLGQHSNLLQLIAKRAGIEPSAFLGFERLGLSDRLGTKCRPWRIEVASFHAKLSILRAAYTIRMDSKIHISEFLTPQERANRQLKSHIFQWYQQQGCQVQFRRDQLWVATRGYNGEKQWIWAG
jgi:hypothetical protein